MHSRTAWIHSCGHQFPFNQHTKAEVMAFTGCASEQTSADVGDVNQQFQLQPMEGANAGQNMKIHVGSILQRLLFMLHLGTQKLLPLAQHLVSFGILWHFSWFQVRKIQLTTRPRRTSHFRGPQATCALHILGISSYKQ